MIAVGQIVFHSTDLIGNEANTSKENILVGAFGKKSKEYFKTENNYFRNLYLCEGALVT